MGRRIVQVLVCLLLVIGAAGVAAHYNPQPGDWSIRIAAFAPFLMLAAVLALLIALIARRWWLTGIAVIVTAAAVGTQAPLYLGQSSPDEADVVVMQANIMLGEGDVEALARTVDEHRVDLLSVSELTDDALERIGRTSLPERLPYSATFTAPGGAGLGVFSRFPLSEPEDLDGFILTMARTVVDVPGHGKHAFYGLHPIPPFPRAAHEWEAEMRRLSQRLSRENRPILAAGDFNGTWDHRALRALFDPDGPGLIDAAEFTGAGSVPTYPTDKSFPALLGLDRIMTGGGPVPVSLTKVDLPGSDHRGVVAGVRL